MINFKYLTLVACLWLPAVCVHADLVNVSIDGVVTQAMVDSGEFMDAQVGDPIRLDFSLDSTDFAGNNPSSRGYLILPGSFTLDINGATTGLSNKFINGQAPYFGVENGSSKDSFYLSGVPDFFSPLDLDESTAAGRMAMLFSVDLDPNTFDSLELLDVAGNYDASEVTGSVLGVRQGNTVPIVGSFANIRIAQPVPEPGCGLLLLAAASTCMVKRRRSVS